MSLLVDSILRSAAILFGFDDLVEESLPIVGVDVLRVVLGFLRVPVVGVPGFHDLFLFVARLLLEHLEHGWIFAAECVLGSWRQEAVLGKGS